MTQNKESGRPGGGAGRREEVGGSGVYPVSGPHPDDPNAPIRDQASFGQGDRGAKGYADSGGSELDLTGANERENEEIERDSES